jgi:hypothetical protein
MVQGQGVFVSRQSNAIQKRTNNRDEQERHQQQHRNPPSTPKAQTAKEVMTPTQSASSSRLGQVTAQDSPPTSPQWGHFHNCSFWDIFEISRKKPDATRVAGMDAWNHRANKFAAHLEIRLDSGSGAREKRDS